MATKDLMKTEIFQPLGMTTAGFGTGAQHQTNFNSLSAQGFRMISLSVYTRRLFSTVSQLFLWRALIERQ